MVVVVEVVVEVVVDVVVEVVVFQLKCSSAVVAVVVVCRCMLWW